MQNPGDRFAAVARDLSGLDTQEATVGRVVELAVELIGGCDHAGISLVKSRRISTAAATDDTVRVGDEKQYEFDQGPCLDSIRTEQTITAPWLSQDQRWPRWSAWVVANLGIGSMLCVRLFTSEHSYGGLNMYSDRAAGFDDHDESIGVALAAHAAVALAAVVKADQLTMAVENRTTIGQAEGILMERYQLSAEQAFAVLLRVSQNENRKLSEVARALVDTRRTPGLPIE